MKSIFIFSAFVSAARSITFALQAVMDKIDGFESWYRIRQNQLAKDDVCKFFVEYRNLVLKTGELPIIGGASGDPNGKSKYRHYFNRTLSAEPPFDEEAVSLSEVYLHKILEVVEDCYRDFGLVIDPDQYYSLENMQRLGFTLEDVEESLGLPRGWTNIEGYPNLDEERMRALRRHIPMSGIKWIFDKYRNKTDPSVSE